MKKLTLVAFIMFTVLTGYSQEVVSTQGDSYSNGNGSIDFTIGEVVINTGTNGTNDITQGFHQTNWNFLGLENHNPQYEVSVFPNPTEDVLNIQAPNFESVSYGLIDAMGRKVAEGNLTESLTTIPVADIAPGKYSLILTSSESILKVFKLVKNQ